MISAEVGVAFSVPSGRLSATAKDAMRLKTGSALAAGATDAASTAARAAVSERVFMGSSGIRLNGTRRFCGLPVTET